MALAFDRNRTYAFPRKQRKLTLAQGEVWFARCAVTGAFSFVAAVIAFL